MSGWGTVPTVDPKLPRGASLDPASRQSLYRDIVLTTREQADRARKLQAMLGGQHPLYIDELREAVGLLAPDHLRYVPLIERTADGWSGCHLHHAQRVWR